jgi:hypothetical protein
MPGATATCSCPAGDRWRAAAVRTVPVSPPVRSAPGAGAPWWKNTARTLHPGSVPGPQVLVSLQQRPALQNPRRRDPALR